MGKLFGDRPVGAVTIVEPRLSAAYAHKARVMFFAVSAVASLVSALVLWPFVSPLVAIGGGAALGVGLGFATAITVVSWPVLRVVWWWAPELLALGLLLAGYGWLSGVATSWLAVLVLVVLAGCVAVVPPARRRVVAWSWCLIVRHRLRLCFARVLRSADRSTPGGSLPLILWARPTPAGERVWVWLRPGLSLAALEGNTPDLAVSCWASEARLVRASSSFAALLRVDLTRRDPLAKTVTHPLAALFGNASKPEPAATVPGSLALDLDDVSEADVAEPAPARGRR
ncbi:hypothetical protein KZZ52_49950 [Dactylosporangium sp. AC04546]|uniref:hypothetical protein n=1 Tax=Dactylosporangium sp. AC04546 TaxID=2862460 RepID=UPI001EDD8246|nr:hypothetical protein [Dactylosporangium sp. AC04546]WVK82009.1 hypothetical protein KZZ52_49950 [Dactylosporangium sp. AC04546]